MLEIVLVLAIVCLIGGGLTFSIIYEKKRKQKLKEVAEEMGLSFSPDGDPHLLTRFSDFKLFNVGRNRQMKNLIQGDSGEVKIAIFEYKYTTGSGKVRRPGISQSFHCTQSISFVRISPSVPKTSLTELAAHSVFRILISTITPSFQVNSFCKARANRKSESTSIRKP